MTLREQVLAMYEQSSALRREATLDDDAASSMTKCAEARRIELRAHDFVDGNWKELFGYETKIPQSMPENPTSPPQS